MSEIRAQISTLPTSEFRVGRVLSRSFEVLFHDFFKFALIAFIALLPYVLLILAGGAAAGGLAGGQPHFAPSVLIGGGLVFFVVFIFFYAVSMAATLYGAFRGMSGRPFSLGDAFGRGLARFFPLVGLGICWSVAIGVGTLLLVVPGLMMLAAFYVALPACVMEGLGPFQSMSQSAALTKGHRWKVFGIYFLVAIVNGAVGQLVVRVFSLGIGLFPSSILYLVWTLLAAAYNSIAIAVIYHDLRVLKEGIDIDRIAAVFD